MPNHFDLMSHAINLGHCVWYASKLISPSRYQAGCCCGWFSPTYHTYNDAVAAARLHEWYSKPEFQKS